MKHFLTAIFICTLAVCCIYTNEISSTSGPDEGWRSVATVSGVDSITHTYVYSLLKSQGIVCAIEGSGVYDVSVPKEKYAQAVRLLKQDLKKRHYNITIHGDGNDIKHTIPQKMWRKSTPKKTHKELIRLELYGPSTDIGALLRSPEVRKEIVTFPYVVCIKSLDRRYLNAGGQEKIGHDFEIEFAVTLDEETGGKRLYCQVWDEGKQILVWGGNEWRHGKSIDTNMKNQRYRVLVVRGTPKNNLNNSGENVESEILINEVITLNEPFTFTTTDKFKTIDGLLSKTADGKLHFKGNVHVFSTAASNDQEITLCKGYPPKGVVFGSMIHSFYIKFKKFQQPTHS